MTEVPGPPPSTVLPSHGSTDAPEGSGPKARILVVDDERNIRRTLELVLRGEGYEVKSVESAEEALGVIEGRGAPVDLVIADILLPGMSGVELLSRLRQDEATRALPVIVISGHASVRDAVQAIKLGAGDLFEKPLNRERVLISVRNALLAVRLSRELARLQAEVAARYEMIGQSPAMQEVFKDIDRVAPTNASVLITGESGTGKELVSRAIHRLSARSRGPFVRVSCSAIPKELFEAELFGHEKGAFSGARSRRAGYFEQAHGGTLFFDEIGDMDPALQAKVLRAIPSGEVTRVGGDQRFRVDVRVIAATHRDLVREVAAGRFREDLFFRLSVFPIHCPALPERIEDIVPLAQAFLAAFSRENGLGPKTFDPAVLRALSRRRFPGNVRELKNLVERSAILCSGTTIEELPDTTPPVRFGSDPEGTAVAKPRNPPPPCFEDPGIAEDDDIDEVDDVNDMDDEFASDEPSSTLSPMPAFVVDAARHAADQSIKLRDLRDQVERQFILEVLERSRWRVSQAASALGMDRTNLHRKMKLLGLKRHAHDNSL